MELDIGVSYVDLAKYIDEQIFTLPGIDNHREELTVLLTGSRALGQFSESSNVDLDVICSLEVYEKIQEEMLDKGRIPSKDHAFYYLPDENWERYFGDVVGRVHFTLTPIERLKEKFLAYDDVAMWIWTNALVIVDSKSIFKDFIDEFNGYPKDVLIKKIKYRYLLAHHWLVDGFPHNHQRKQEELFSASLSLLNGIHELYKLFFLLDHKPFPYSEKLPFFVNKTRLGEEFELLLTRIINLTLGYGFEFESIPIWERLNISIESLLYDDSNPDSMKLSREIDRLLLENGVDEKWVRGGYDNIEELLYEKLGPSPSKY